MDEIIYKTMTSFTILRAVLLASVVTSFILTIAGFGLSSKHNLPAGDDLTPEVLPQTSALVSALVANKKTFAIALGVSSIALVGSYYKEISEFFKEHMLPKTIHNHTEKIEEPAVQNPPTPVENPDLHSGQKNQIDQGVPQTNANPQNANAQIQPDIDGSDHLISSSSNSFGRSDDNPFLDEEEGRGLFKAVFDYVWKGVVGVVKTVVVSVAEVGMSVACFVNGGNYCEMKKNLSVNPLFQDPHNPDNQNIRNAIHFAASVAKGLNLKNSPSVVLQSVERLIEDAPKEKPKLRQSVLEVAKSYIQGKSDEEIKELIKEKAIHHFAYAVASRYPSEKLYIDSDPNQKNQNQININKSVSSNASNNLVNASSQADKLDKMPYVVQWDGGDGRGYDKYSAASSNSVQYSSNRSQNSIERSAVSSNSYKSQASLAKSAVSNQRGKSMAESVGSDDRSNSSGHSAEAYLDRFGGFI